MDPRDRLRLRLAGVKCAVCSAAMPVNRIRILAQRDELAFVELRCEACGTESLAMVAVSADDPWIPSSIDGRLPDEFPIDDLGASGTGRRARRSAPPIDMDDVDAMRSFLES